MCRFGNDKRKAIGSIEIRIPIPHGSFLPIRLDIFPINVTFFLGLDILDHLK